jgi:hypothetical protein
MNVKDFDFLNGSAGRLILSLLIKDDALLVSLIDDEIGTMYYHKTYHNLMYTDESQSQKILADSNLYESKIEKILIAVQNNAFTFLPHVDHSVATIIPGFDHRQVFVDKIASNDAYVHFGLKPAQLSLIHRMMRDRAYTLHHFSNLLALYHIQSVDDLVHVHLESTHLNVFILKDGKFHGYNRYEMSTDTDVLYFVAAIYQEYHLDVFKDILYLSGWVDESSKIFMTLHGYIAKIAWVEDLNMSLAGIENHVNKPEYYFTHFVQARCAS